MHVQEAIMKKKYGGLMPKKPPLISKVSYYRLNIFRSIVVSRDVEIWRSRCWMNLLRVQCRCYVM